MIDPEKIKDALHRKDVKKLSAHKKNLEFWQWRIVVMGWFTYAAYYLGRVNLSIAIPDLRESLNLSSRDRFVGQWILFILCFWPVN